MVGAKQSLHSGAVPDPFSGRVEQWSAFLAGNGQIVFGRTDGPERSPFRRQFGGEPGMSRGGVNLANVASALIRCHRLAASSNGPRNFDSSARKFGKVGVAAAYFDLGMSARIIPRI